LNRHTALARALASVAAQRLPDDAWAEIIVVDNSCDGNAGALVLAAAAASALPVRYVSMPRPGVATARNAGIAAASGAFIAFLDDDEEAWPGWLAALLRAVQTGQAVAAFGPVYARAEGGEPIGAFERYFSRSLDLPDGADATHLAAYFGTNNSIFAARLFHRAQEAFCTSLDQTGGEDSLFLKELVLAGHRLAWAPDAGVIEWVPSQRLCWRYVGRRKFLSGQIRTFVHGMVRPAQRGSILFWMMVGAVQFFGAGLGAVLAYGFDKARARRLHLIALGGLGKLLWTKRFRPELYGFGLVS
jgi:glycosyltransferase involved in cell wall biosynthesis